MDGNTAEVGEEHMSADGVTYLSKSWCDEYMVCASACQLAQLAINDSVFQPRSAKWPQITAQRWWSVTEYTKIKLKSVNINKKQIYRNFINSFV